MQYSLILQLFNIRQNTMRLMTDTEFNCMQIGLISTSTDKYHNDKKLPLKYNRHAQR